MGLLLATTEPNSDYGFMDTDSSLIKALRLILHKGFAKKRTTTLKYEFSNELTTIQSWMHKMDIVTKEITAQKPSSAHEYSYIDSSLIKTLRSILLKGSTKNRTATLKYESNNELMTTQSLMHKMDNVTKESTTQKPSSAHEFAEIDSTLKI